MSNASDFVIENGILKKYVGPGGDVVVPEGVTEIGERAFYFCKGLTSLVIPDSVICIGETAFASCKSLTRVTVPNSVTSIGDRAFEDCSSLDSITISENITSIGNEAFKGCVGLANEKGFVIVNGILFCYAGNEEHVAIPDGVKSIGGRAFVSGLLGCQNLKSVSIPGGVSNIGESAFSYCSNLESVSVPNSLTGIGKWAFMGCKNLRNLTIPMSVTSIGSAALQGCSSLRDITIPEGVSEIGGSTFKSCSSLVNVTIPHSVTSVGDNAFSFCKSLVSVTIPDSVKRMGKELFSDCVKLQWIKMPGKLSDVTSPNISVALLVGAKKKKYYAYSSKANNDNIKEFAKSGRWDRYDMELINNGPTYKYKLPERIVGALGRLLDPVELTDEAQQLYCELLNKNAKKFVQMAEEMKEKSIVEDLFSLNILDEKSLKVVKKQLAASTIPELAALA